MANIDENFVVKTGITVGSAGVNFARDPYVNYQLTVSETDQTLQGRVPVKVLGKVRKGDMMIAASSGFAKASADPLIGQVIGKALENFDGTSGVIEVVVGRL